MDVNISYNDVVRWTHECLYEMNLECDVVFPVNMDINIK